jgi:hypothetical protein
MDAIPRPIVLWCLVILAVCVPLALRRFNRTLAA